MKHSPLILNRYVVPELACSANPNFDPEKACEGGMEEYTVETAVTRQESAKDEIGHSWSVEMTISQKLKEGQNFPYKFEITIVGFFCCLDGLPPSMEEERFVRVNGNSMLYGAARELVRALTSQGPWGELFLPSVSFYQGDAGEKQEAHPVTKPT